MVWDIKTSCGREADKVAHLTVPYLQGKGLDIGCGLAKIWPSAIGIDSMKDYGGPTGGNIIPSVSIVSEGEQLDFKDKSLDYVFSSHFLEHVVDYKAALKEWWRVIRPGGHLVLYLPHKEFYPNIGKEGSNPDHKHDFLPEDIINTMKGIGSWELIENESRSKDVEYSFFQVYRRLKETGKQVHKFNIWQRNPNGLKRCLVIRYGAIGDALQMSSILPLLKKQGYYITMNCAPKTYEILKHDPHIDEWFVQAENFVPNSHLGNYWASMRQEGRWDKTINLCESIEGALLTLPDRLTHYHSQEARHKLLNVNYLERTHDIADVPWEFNPRFYPSKDEIKWAERTAAEVGNVPIIAWAVTGSALHKVYPYIQTVIAWILQKTPAHIFLLGDKDKAKELQDGIIACLKEDGQDISRIHAVCGEWTIGQSLTFVRHVDCVVGPETGILNAVCMEDVPKVIYLSHSSHENLTKYWKNTTVLEASKEKCPCAQACHRMIYDWASCVEDTKTKAALCASSISQETVFDAIMRSLGYIKQGNTPPTPPFSPPSGTNVGIAA